VLSGQVMAQRSGMSAAPLIRDGRLVPLLTQHMTDHMSVYVYYGNRTAQPTRVRAFIDLAVERGAKAAASGFKKGVTAGAHGVERGAQAVAGGVERGAKVAARGIEQGATATAHAAKTVASKVGPSPASSSAASH
jgi:hypothetical protein